MIDILNEQEAAISATRGARRKGPELHIWLTSRGTWSLQAAYEPHPNEGLKRKSWTGLTNAHEVMQAQTHALDWLYSELSS